MKTLLLAMLAAVGLGGCYAEGAPYGAYDTGYYTQPSYGYGYGANGYASGYTNGGAVYSGSYGRGYRAAPAYRPASVYVSAPGYRAAPVYRAASAYHGGHAYGGHGARRF